MKTTPTYQEYLNNPEYRAQIERQVTRERAAAFRKFLWAPLAGMFRRSAPKPAPLSMRTA